MQYNNIVEVLVGKEGVNTTHLNTLLKRHKIIKVRFSDKEKMNSELPGVVVKKIGKTIVLKNS